MTVAAGAAAATGGILLLRTAWGGERRDAHANGRAWAVLALGVLLAAAGHGAWGVAMASLAAMAAATACLGRAAYTAAPGRGGASQRRAHMMPQGREPWHLGRRTLTFLFTVPLGLIAALLAGLALRAAAGMAGWHDADGNVLALMAVPVIWAILSTILLIEPSRARQSLWLAAPALAGGVAIISGGNI